MVKFGLAIALLAATGTNAFTPTNRPNNVAFKSATSSSSSTQLYQNPLAPLTVWGDQVSNIRKLHTEMNEMQTKPDFAPTISAKDLNIYGDVDAQLQYAKDNAMDLKLKMEENGAVIFRDFELMKSQEGFTKFYEAIGMNPCLDPLHSVSARPTVDGDKNSAVYEAVNKESRKNFFIGMHNEFVGTRAPRAAAFVCFKAADEGGEFLIGDGRAIFRDLKPDLVDKLYNRSIRYSVMELPFFGWIDNVPDMAQDAVKSGIRGLATAAINSKVDFSVDLQWGEGGYDGVRMLQARAPSQPPIVIHPVTGDPTWFCNVHSHSSKLRKDREEIYGAERFEDGASQINKSDMYFGDDGSISDEDLEHMNEVTMKNVQYVKMTEGDVVLLDNYKCLHGRNVFDGTRKHGVAWFEGWEGEEEMKKMFAEKSKVTEFA